MTAEHHEVVVIGAGFGGIGASVRLAEAGIEHVILEKRDDVGGTWLANTYPGCRCDIASHLYSFSFALNPDWSNSYSLQPEIWDYLRRVAEDYDVISRVRFGCKVDSVRWSESDRHWVLDTSDGTITAAVVIAAHGFLSEPAIPHFDGIESFTGEVMHSAEWDPSYDVTGKRVAVIGTGASAVQIVPEVVKDASELFVFQRTAAWILPHRGRPIRDWERALYRRVPLTQRAVRGWHYWSAEFLAVPALMNPQRGRLLRKLALKHLEEQVPDPELRKKLTPAFKPGCKRLTPSNDYLPAIASSRTSLVTSGIDRFEPSGIRTVRTASLRRTASPTTSTSSSWPPASGSPTTRSRRSCSAGTDARCARSGTPPAWAATTAPRSPASPTCSCWRVPTPASATRRCST